MDTAEYEKLDEIHTEVRDSRTDIEVVRQRIENIDRRTEEQQSAIMQNRDQAMQNAQSISRMQGMGALIVGGIGTVIAKVSNIIP